MFQSSIILPTGIAFFIIFFLLADCVAPTKLRTQARVVAERSWVATRKIQSGHWLALPRLLLERAVENGAVLNRPVTICQMSIQRR